MKKIIIVACVAAVAGIIAIVVIALGLGGPKARVSLPSSGQEADSLNTTHSSSINIIKNDASAPYVNGSNNETEAKPPTIEDQQYPIPAGFTRVSNFSLGSDWKFWGKYTTDYASGGEGPSERWDNAKMNKLDMVAGFDFKIGPDFDYKTGTIQGNPLDGVVALKFPRCVSVGGERGDYIPHIDWKVDGSNSIGMAGKE